MRHDPRIDIWLSACALHCDFLSVLTSIWSHVIAHSLPSIDGGVRGRVRGWAPSGATIRGAMDLVANEVAVIVAADPVDVHG